MKKLLEFQKKMVAISKDSTNPFYKSKYFDINKLLEEVKPILNELGLVLVQALSNIDGKPAIKTELYNVENAEQYPLLSSTTPLPENTDPQKMGSTITYYRRYAIQTMLCLQAEDDDGNLASKKEVKNPVKENGNVYKLVLESCGTLAELQQAWLKVPVEEQTKELVALKDNLKTKLK